MEGSRAFLEESDRSVMMRSTAGLRSDMIGTNLDQHTPRFTIDGDLQPRTCLYVLQSDINPNDTASNNTEKKARIT
jgi:hypothetical protein